MSTAKAKTGRLLGLLALGTSILSARAAMQHLNYHHLRYFFEAAKHGSMSAAARALHVTQPTVSSQIRALEEQCGGPLLLREGNRLLLTPLGQHVHSYTADIFALGDELRATLQGTEIQSPLQVGVVQALPNLVVYNLLEPAMELASAGLHVHTGELSELVEQLRVHQLDLVLSDYPLAPRHTNVHNHPLGRSPVGVFGTPALREQYSFPKDLEDAPFLLMPHTTSLRRSLDHALYREGVKPRVVGEFRDSALLKVFASRGHGFIVAPCIVAGHLQDSFGLGLAWEIPESAEDLYLLSMERHVEHPAAQQIVRMARKALPALSDKD